jgi:ATP-dependent DNA helicase RecQ
MVLKVLDVDGAVDRVRGGWVAGGSDFEYDLERYRRIEEARKVEQQAVLDYQSTTGCRMEFLLRQLDDPHAAPCGRCDNCTGRPWSTEVSAAVMATAEELLSRPGVDIAPRRQWPAGLAALEVPMAGKVGADEVAEPGRVVGRLTDVGWGNRLRELFSSTVDGPVPDDLFGACVKVLAAWDWGRRPVGVVVLGSVKRPRLVESLGERISTVGQLPLLGHIESVGSAQRKVNSAQRLAQVWHALRVGPELADRLSTVDGPVLVVDDLVDTGWTMTAAAKLLRDAGAPAVLPFALAVTN